MDRSGRHHRRGHEHRADSARCHPQHRAAVPVLARRQGAAGQSTHQRQTLGVVGCRPSTGNGRQVRYQTRSLRGCQDWRFHHIAGAAARYTVTNAASGLQLAARRDGSGQLRLVRPRHRNLDRRAWTLTPTNSGTWTLSTSGASVTVKLLLP